MPSAKFYGAHLLIIGETTFLNIRIRTKAIVRLSTYIRELSHSDIDANADLNVSQTPLCSYH